jgi:hypothetical protein
MTDLTADDWADHTDEQLRMGLGITLMAVSDPLCDPTVVDDLMAFAQDIRAELARRAATDATRADVTTDNQTLSLEH